MDSQMALKRLQALVDEETYRIIREEFAGMTVYFPSNTVYADRDERNLLIKDDFYSGKYEVSDLARKYDLSISRIYKIIQTR